MIGIVLLIFICIGLVVYVIRESCKQELETQEANVAEMTLYSSSWYLFTAQCSCIPAVSNIQSSSTLLWKKEGPILKPVLVALITATEWMWTETFSKTGLNDSETVTEGDNCQRVMISVYSSNKVWTAFLVLLRQF